MGVLNPTGSGDSHNWNYTKPENPGFSLSIIGTVIAIQEVQAMNFGSDGRPTTPKFWDDSHQPVMNIRLVLVGPKGGYRTWTIQPASKAAREGKKRSVHIDLFNLAGGRNMTDLIGKTIKVETQAPPQGFSYGIGNPRPWEVSLVTDQGPFKLTEELDPIYLMPKVLADGAVSGGTMNSPAMSASTLPTGGDPNQAAAPQQQPAPQQQQPPQGSQPSGPGDDEDIPF